MNAPVVRAGLDDDHAAAAARAWTRQHAGLVEWRFGFVIAIVLRYVNLGNFHLNRSDAMTEFVHPAASDAPPSFITPPGETDVLMVVMAVILVLAVLMFGIMYFRLHSLPERMAHRSQKIQFEIVAVLGLISLFTHMHIFWIAGLLLALIELPDFGTPLSRIAGSVEKIAGTPPGDSARGPHGTGPIVTEAHEVTGTPPKTYEVSQADKVATLPTTTRQPKRS